jgi:hypothetical protein
MKKISYSGSGSQLAVAVTMVKTTAMKAHRSSGERAEYQAQVRRQSDWSFLTSLARSMPHGAVRKVAELVSLQTMLSVARPSVPERRSRVKTKPTRGDGTRPDGFSMHWSLVERKRSCCGTALLLHSLPIPADGFEGADLPQDDSMGLWVRRIW